MKVRDILTTVLEDTIDGRKRLKTVDDVKSRDCRRPKSWSGSEWIRNFSDVRDLPIDSIPDDDDNDANDDDDDDYKIDSVDSKF